MSILNQSNCTTGGNVGMFPCAFNPSIYRRYIAIPKGYVIPASTLADVGTLLTALRTGMIADNAGQRWRMSGLLTQLADNTTARATENKDNYMITTQLPPYYWTWDMTVQFGQFAKWKGYSLKQAFYDFLFIDDMGNLIGTQKTDETGAVGLGGVSLVELVIEDMKIATVSQVTKFNVSMQVLDNTELNVQMGLVQAGINPADYETLLEDVTISASTRASTTTHIYVKLKYNGIGAVSSVGAVYGAQLANILYILFTDNGATLTPSAAAYSAVNDDYDFTVTTLTVGHTITARVAAPSVVAVGSVNIPIESNVYSYTVS